MSPIRRCPPGLVVLNQATASGDEFERTLAGGQRSPIRRQALSSDLIARVICYCRAHPDLDRSRFGMLTILQPDG